MKIILFSYGLVGGGAERVANLVFNGLAQRGHEVYIVTHPDINPAYKLSPQIRILNYDVDSKGNPFYRRWKILKSIRRIVKLEKPDVCIGLMRVYAEFMYYATFGLHQKLVVWDHSSCRLSDLSTEAFLRKYIEYSLYDRAFVLTEEDKKNLWLKKNIRVMPNPLSFSAITNVCGDREKTVLAVGNFNSWEIKGFDLLIKAWSGIEEIYPEWKLRIIGGGDKRTIGDLVKSLNLDNRVELIDFDNDIQSQYRVSSIFVLSSRQEGFPMVLLEAMSQGCACVACDNNGRTKEVTGGAGLIYETANIEDMRTKLEILLLNTNKRKELGELAIKRSKEFTLETIMDKWETELNELIR